MPEASSLTPAHAAALVDSVRAFAQAVARDVTREGPVIRHIELRWEDSVRVDPLAPGLAVLAAPYYEVRVDTTGMRVEETGYFTGLAEHGVDGWQLRDAHWSVVSTPPPVP